MNSFDKIIQEEYQKILQEQRDTIEIRKISPRKTAKMKSIYPDMIDAFKVVAEAPGKSLSRNIVQRNLSKMPELQGWKSASNKYLFVISDDSFKGKNDKESRIVVIKRLNDEDLNRSGLIPFGSKSYFIFQDDFEKELPKQELETIAAQSAEIEQLRQTNAARAEINKKLNKKVNQIQQQLDQKEKELANAEKVAKSDKLKPLIPIPKVTFGTNPDQDGHLLDGGVGNNWGGTMGILNGLIASVISKFDDVDVASVKRDEEKTKSGKRSDHWDGSLDSSAVDFDVPDVPPDPIIGDTIGDQIFISILNALGQSAPKEGGIKNINKDGMRYQVIWRDPDHYNHVHVGIRNKNLNWEPTTQNNNDQSTDEPEID